MGDVGAVDILWGVTNRLYYGDNLAVLKANVPAESVDLIYLDPPFNSDAVYNVSFAGAGDATAQIHAFDDTWRWSTETSAAYDGLIGGGGLPSLAAECLQAIRALAKESPLTAYMVAMAPRLVELHRVLKSTGSLYLHCDPTASHYLKIMLDAIFGAPMFRNEIIWRRTGAHGKTKRYSPIHDVILFYTKTENAYWAGSKRPYMRGHVEEYFVQDEEGWRTNYYGNVLTGSGLRGGESGSAWKGIDPSAKGRHWAIPGKLLEGLSTEVEGMTQHQKLDFLYERGDITITPGEAWPNYHHYLKPGDGQPTGDIWAYEPYTGGTVFGTEAGIDADIRWLSPRDAERLGYPTQKPVGLLERIIKASCPEDGIVLDPFCGCGTTVAAAQNLDRQWIGIDITFIAVDLIRNRLKDVFGDEIEDTYEVLGVPADLAAAHSLFARNPFDFERWAVSLVRGTPNEKQVGDHGRDGLVRFFQGKKTKPGEIVVSVKGGKQLNPAMIRDLEGVVSHDDKLSGGILITLWQPSKGIQQVADTAGTFLDPAGNPYPKIQVLTVEDLLNDKIAKLPPVIRPYTEATQIAEDTSIELF